MRIEAKKQELRKRQKYLCNLYVQQQLSYLQRANIQIQESVKSLVIEVATAENVGIFYPMKYEPNLLPITIDLSRFNFSLPKIIDKKHLAFLEYEHNRTKLQHNIFNIYEPVKTNQVTPDVLIIPGLSFSMAGYRLGYGLGYYDRYIAELRKCGVVTVIGVCFHYQLALQLPIQPHDQKVDYIITELTKIRV